jgi:hypothetical protein
MIVSFLYIYHICLVKGNQFRPDLRYVVLIWIHIETRFNSKQQQIAKTPTLKKIKNIKCFHYHYQQYSTLEIASLPIFNVCTQCSTTYILELLNGTFSLVHLLVEMKLEHTKYVNKTKGF